MIRPASAPSTKRESENAQLSAGETDHLKKKETAPPVRDVAAIERRLGVKFDIGDGEPDSAKAVDSDQDLENLLSTVLK